MPATHPRVGRDVEAAGRQRHRPCELDGRVRHAGAQVGFNLDQRLDARTGQRLGEFGRRKLIFLAKQ